jgi:hypothetical protein
MSVNIYKEKAYCNVMVFEVKTEIPSSKVGAPDRGLHSDEPADDELPF